MNKNKYDDMLSGEFLTTSDVEFTNEDSKPQKSNKKITRPITPQEKQKKVKINFYVTEQEFDNLVKVIKEMEGLPKIAPFVHGVVMKEVDRRLKEMEQKKK